MSDTLIPRGWRYADHIPYSTPSSLADLRGPTSGTVRVDGNIDTSLNPVYDLTLPSRRWSLYVKVVQSGTADEQAELLDRDTLIELWPTLMLPDRCRAIWEAAFPELAATTRKSA